MTATYTYIKVILPLRIEWEPYYSVETTEKIRIGSRVRVMFSGMVPFGNEQRLGLALGLSSPSWT